MYISSLSSVVIRDRLSALRCAYGHHTTSFSPSNRTWKSIREREREVNKGRQCLEEGNMRELLRIVRPAALFAIATTTHS